jgi:uncharacterized repeat protein (TIGR03803 family)
VFAVNIDGTSFTNLHTFSALSGSNLTNSDGANPYAGLILSGNTLYGAATGGGSSGRGTIFAVNTDGMGFTNLHNFTALNSLTNSDGVGPVGLILSGSTLYGMANGGGSSGYGAVFNINTNGTGFTNLHNFTGSDGASPWDGLILSGNTLYGMVQIGGSSGKGTIFSLSLGTASIPSLIITYSGNQAIVSWPSAATGWTLQTNDNLGTTNWVNYGGVINNTVTNSPPTGTLFFRLFHP